eukprot:TRINITY_DN2500_c0_g1_i2.p1 TRINITY_DN2500_c0_g1~~TRINITY_DN2500_c0_g1_i2.p1  ORF type:complete len:320 (+),score=117.05 TRINITY_DN2500_c0_g1_i2:579-1538(+)
MLPPPKRQAPMSNNSGAGEAPALGVIPTAPLFQNSVDDETAAIAQLVSTHCMTGHVEIEARLGQLCQKVNKQRVKNPWSKSSFIVEDAGTYFEARVGEQSFFKVNQDMNHLVESGRKQGRNVKYSKAKTFDVFTDGQARHSFAPQKNGSFAHVESVSKKKLQTLDIFNPKKAWDVRFRVAVEEVVAPPPVQTDCAAFDAFLKTVAKVRRKERRSYQLDCFRIDLTTVEDCAVPKTGLESLGQVGALDAVVMLEVEVELDVEVLRKEKARAAAGHKESQDRFTALCRLFMDNVRGLADAASNVRNPTLAPLVTLGRRQGS